MLKTIPLGEPYTLWVNCRMALQIVVLLYTEKGAKKRPHLFLEDIRQVGLRIPAIQLAGGEKT